MADVRALVSFRAAAVRGRARRGVGVGLGLAVALTVVAAWAPAHLPGAGGSTAPAGSPLELVTSYDVLLLLPSIYLGSLLIAVVSAVSSGGGRELLARDHAVAFPVSPTTDHLGALLMAPLNIAWLLQGWLVLGATAYALGPDNLLAAQLTVLLWLAAATALAQLVGWVAEWLRRGRHGPWVVRGMAAGLVVAGGALVATDRVVPVLDRSPTLEVLLVAMHGAEGRRLPWVAGTLALLLLTLLLVAAGAVAAHRLARRPVLEESRLETSVQRRRPDPRSDLAALVRVDRTGVWRAVPLRRGFVVLAVLPGLIASAARLDWEVVAVLPALVAAGGALLFGVNAWSLDGRGVLWRETLPVSPRVVFVARALVLGEVLVAATVLAVVPALLGPASTPTPAELVALVCAAVVVVVQVVSASMRWSVTRPFAVDLRSARATPAPPLAMVGYSTRLALATTLTAMVLAAAARAGWHVPVLLAVPFLLVSLLRLVRAARAWGDAESRSRVVTTVAG